MKRFYFSRVRDGRPPFASIMVSGVIEAESCSAAQEMLDAAFRNNRSPTTHASFDWLDLDEAPKRDDGILVTTVMAR